MLSLVWVHAASCPPTSAHAGCYVESQDLSRFNSDDNAHWHTAEEALDFPADAVIFVGGPNADRFVIQPGDSTYDAPCHGCDECSSVAIELMQPIVCGECGTWWSSRGERVGPNASPSLPNAEGSF